MKVIMTSAYRLGLSALLGVSVALFPHSALAHNAVVDYNPEPNAVVTESPVAIAITTNDALLDLGGEGRGFAIALRDEQGLYYGDGCVMLEGPTLSALLELGAAGTYTIAYQYVSADGHSLSDQYTIEFTPGPNHQPATGSSAAPQCGVGAEELTPEAPGGEVVIAAQAPQQSDANPWLIVSGFGVAALAGYALVQFFRRKP